MNLKQKKENLEDMVANTLEYSARVPFYQKPEYEALRKDPSIENLIQGPIIDGELLKTIPNEFVVKNNKEVLFGLTTSGTSGKPKVLYTSTSMLEMRTKLREKYKAKMLSILNYGKLSESYKNGKIEDIYFILKVPPTPPSYTPLSIIMSSFEFEGAYINNLLSGMDPTPLFKEAMKHNVTMVLSSLRGLEEIGNGIDPEVKKELSSWSSLYISQGGESVTDNTVEYLRKLYNIGPRRFLITIYANTEGGVIGEGPTSKEIYAYESNLLFLLKENNERVLLKDAPAGTVGELVLTHLISPEFMKRDLSPLLINYNTHDLIKVVGRKEGMTIISFEGRSDKIYRIGGSAKIDDYLALDLLYFAKAKTDVEDGQFTIGRQGLKDQLIFTYSGEANESEVKKVIEEKLLEIPEFSYALSSNALDLIVQKGKIESTQGKKKILVDARI